MKFIADASVWIDHLHKEDQVLSKLLTERKILTHEIVIGELACGTFKNRDVFLDNLKMLRLAKNATFEEHISMIEKHKLYGLGLGFSDIQILASALLMDSGILTKDKAMLLVMKKLGIAVE
jgi:predicted nucleic acid-binding protein